MNILLTGGTGYIGSHTAAALSKRGHNVVLFDNLCNSRAEVVDRLSEIAGKPQHFIQGDVLDASLLEATLMKYQIDAVIHFAGLKAVGESVNHPLDYYESNVQGSINLLKTMGRLNIKNLVFSSSATVYGEPKYLPFDESHPTSVSNPYGRTKLNVEEMLQDLTCSDPDWSIVSLRYFNPVGADESGLIGEDPQGIPNNLMPFIAGVAIGRYPHLSIYGGDYPTEDGTCVRDYIHVTDLAAGHCAALDYLEKQTGWQAINLGAGRGVSVLEILRAFEKVSGKKIPFKIVGRREGDVAAYYADATKAYNMLGWRTTKSLEDMCISAWNYIQKQSAQK